MKKLFIITDVSTLDARYYLRALMIGTVVRAELADYENKTGDHFLYLRPDGTYFGTTYQDNKLWSDDGSRSTSAYHACIKVKPLQ